MVKLKGKQRRDTFYYRAKDEGYRSRASFKLTHMDERYKFLSSARAVLDLCAAPGGWMQVAVRRCPVGSLVIGVDLAKITPVHGAVDILGDITDPSTKTAIRRKMEASGVAAFDVVLHDGSPNVGGAWKAEASSQSALVVDALKIATSMLAPKGTFITKIFRSQDYSAIIYCLKQLFEKVEATKPPASRSTSAEIYAICLKYKAPAKIDPRLLDIKHLFQGTVERPVVTDVLRSSKQKRNRDGYDEENPTLWKVGKASDFIASEEPLEFLGSVNAISFDDPASLPIKNSKFTTDEIKSVCEDLYVVDKKSFKHLLKWRSDLRKELFPSQASEKVANVESEKKGKDDEQLLQELEELTDILDRKKRKEKKKLARRRLKDKHRKATGMQPGATEDNYGDHELFDLLAIKRKKELNAVDPEEPDQDDDHNNYADSGDEQEDPLDSGDSSDDIDADDARQKYDEHLEELLDEVYDRFLSRKGKSYERKRARRVDPNADDTLLEDDEAEDELEEMDEDSDHIPPEDEEANPLLALDRHKPSKQQIVEQWFSQDVFTDAGSSVAHMSESDDERAEKPQKVSKKTEKKARKKRARVDKEDGEIEIVPAEPVTAAGDGSSSSSDESELSEDLDDDEKAEVLACAKKMLRKKQREQILDDAYNRYMYDDDEAVLPKWFAQEEKQHCQPIKPITKEEVQAMKALFREIDARPIKKVAEAKARKKRAAMRSLEKARKKAEVITEKNDLSEHTKRKMIDQVYRKATPKRPKKEYVVAKKGVAVKAGKNKVLVDRRMKKDKRSASAGKKGKKGKAGGKAKGPKGKASSGKKAGKGRK